MNTKPSDGTVMQYLNFVYLRLKDGFEISDEECFDTYSYYYNYCIENDLDMVGYQSFYRELKKTKIEVMQIKIPGEKTRRRRRIFKLIQLEKMFGKHRSNSVMQTGLFELGGEKYRITVKLTKLSDDTISIGLGDTDSDPEHSGDEIEE